MTGTPARPATSAALGRATPEHRWSATTTTSAQPTSAIPLQAATTRTTRIRAMTVTRDRAPRAAAVVPAPRAPDLFATTTTSARPTRAIPRQVASTRTTRIRATTGTPALRATPAVAVPATLGPRLFAM